VTPFAYGDSHSGFPELLGFPKQAEPGVIFQVDGVQ
jgi:hypothetical protein